MNLNDPLFERSLLVFDEQTLLDLSNARILVAGVGGVGGFVAEALARAGAQHLTLVDHDRVSLSNKNRQIVALDNTIGQLKVSVMAERIAQINPNCQVDCRAEFFAPEVMASLVAEFDVVIDAIDSLNCKVALVAEAVRQQKRVFSSMGAGRRIDPSQIRVTDISKTHTCGLARVMRQRLRKLGIKKGVPVVFSTELPKEPGPMEEIANARGRVVNGTASYMPGIFGLILAGLVINAFVSKEHV
ncbi:tRNA threonylcarbamoyladenosine dehydratase [Thiomicrospira cyclica]|uniref:UBA/THIF-type NAD/FAD binding protein n=1 Tax=Thiomicrospira cyclica (strain DSM 14477 / JCM 11371 / ALM1) TaxID=717773 RepID=F6D9G8_THICA|nr:tRNA threonylcarbamoyladenosine dehydratase [Thiomicrospira cyclica]AEG30925.1 UBA/THIF-type NAD/FAD binding protein [Thiomicrospira cyclica ALM1]